MKTEYILDGTNTGEVLGACRSESGKSQRYIATCLDRYHQQYQRWERGKTDPSSENLHWALNAMGYELIVRKKT